MKIFKLSDVNDLEDVTSEQLKLIGGVLWQHITTK